MNKLESIYFTIFMIVWAVVLTLWVMGGGLR
jgi:heme/copper-type cytochrome/quinol oxidase subunit 4